MISAFGARVVIYPIHHGNKMDVVVVGLTYSAKIGGLIHLPRTLGLGGNMDKIKLS